MVYSLAPNATRHRDGFILTHCALLRAMCNVDPYSVLGHDWYVSEAELISEVSRYTDMVPGKFGPRSKAFSAEFAIIEGPNSSLHWQ